MFNNERIKILSDLIYFNHDIRTLKSMLSKIGFDSDCELVCLSQDNFVEILQRSLDKKIPFLELEEWANLIECREDISFENETIQEMIFKLANPYLYGRLKDEQLLAYINKERAKIKCLN